MTLSQKEINEQLVTAILEIDEEKAVDATKKGIALGLNPLDLINDSIRPALDLMGERLSSGSIFLPELMLAATITDNVMTVLEPELMKQSGSTKKLGKVLMATVKGDIHDIGKNIVSLLMKASGFDVVDIGVDKSNEEILGMAKTEDVDIIGLSALLTTTMPQMKDFMELLQESGLRDRFRVLVGGAPVSQQFADLIGADGYGSDATRAVYLAKKILKADS